jgi:hypothetical protein
MPQVLTTNALILCPHSGVGTSVPTDPKWTVNGGVVLLDNDRGTLAGCRFLLPCIGYQLRSMKLNATQLDGRQVMLVTDFTVSVTGFPLTITESHRTFDNSTPAPIPPGTTPPAVPPELQEVDEPIVAAAPASLVFSKSGFGGSGQPESLTMTFGLQSQFPRAWLLSMLSIPDATRTDITNGGPPGIEVSPAGGAWPDPALTVVVTLLGAFMATLPLGKHYFVLTAVNFRGKSRHAQVELSVGS